MKKQNDNEECWVLLGKVRPNGKWRAWHTRYSVGAPASVNFNWEWVMKREEIKGDVLGFIHTHPSFTADPSGTDYQTMEAWVTCFGKPLLCAIKGIDGLRAHWFFDDIGFMEEKIGRCFKLFWGLKPPQPPKPVKAEIIIPQLVLAQLEARVEYDETFEELNAIQKGEIDVEE